MSSITRLLLVSYLDFGRSPLSVCSLGLEDLRRDVDNLAGTCPGLHESTDAMYDKLDIVQAESNKAIAILDDLLLCQQLESDAIDIEMKEVNPFVASKIFLKDLRDKVTVEPFDGDKTTAKKLVLNCDENILRIAFNKLLHVAVEKAGKELLKIELSFTVDSALQRSSSRFSAMQNHFGSTRIHPVVAIGAFSIDMHYDSDNNGISRLIENIAAKRLVLEREAQFDDRVSSISAWIARNIIDRHQGSIHVFNGKNGPALRISFPVFVRVNPTSVESGQLQWGTTDEAPRDLRSTIEDTGIVREHPLRLLIVDDSKMVRKVMGNLMSSLGHAFQEASDGAEAVEMVRQSLDNSEPFDMILMDNQMPRMMGQEATKIIRTELRFGGMILGVTGNAMAEDVRTFIDHGADSVILKPLTAEKFVQARLHHLKTIMRREKTGPKDSTNFLLATE